MKFIVAVETHRHKCIGTHLRTAVAFGACMIIVVGSPIFSTHGAHGAQKRIEVVHFYAWDDCLHFAREQGYSVYGITPLQIREEDVPLSIVDVAPSRAIYDVEFNDSAMFVVGEKDGLTAQLMSLCDTLIHVPFPNLNYQQKIAYDSKIGICIQEFAAAFSASEGTKVVSEKFAIDESVSFKSFKSKLRSRRALLSGSASAEEVDVLSSDLGDLFT